jgi:hypothetical protein
LIEKALISAPFLFFWFSSSGSLLLVLFFWFSSSEEVNLLSGLNL